MAERLSANPAPRWHHRARHALRHSLRLRLIVLFVLLALAMAGTFLFGMQRALSVGWRDAARPLVADYVERLTQEIGTPPSVQRAQALTQRLPLSVHISGPKVNWRSEPERAGREQPAWGTRADRWDAEGGEPRLLSRATADGHVIEFGLSLGAWNNQPRRVGWITLGVLLLLTALAYAHVRRLLRPLDDIRAGAQRFGSGDFSRPIPVNPHHERRELEQLASTINTMADDIHQMLEAKRALLLAISHELRSPLTRARLNTELLPETADYSAQRDALLRDLGEMRDLISDLLESERLTTRHATLQLEPTDLAALAREVVDSLHGGADGASPAVRLEIAEGLPAMKLDRGRIKLMLRNLLDNTRRHAGQASEPTVLSIQPLQASAGRAVTIRVRDHGPGVSVDHLLHLAEPFYRPDAARARATGGVGLGLYLCRLVAQAHGGQFHVRNAQPGLEVSVTLPIPA